MAGSLAVVSYEAAQETLTATKDQWQVFFSRFISFPSLSSTCPSLAPPRSRYRRRTGGTWISSTSPTASLQLLRHHRSSSDAAVLSVCFQGRVLEEHHVSKLHFSWPQMACVAGFPERGSRAVFASYKDSCGEVQKFAVRFSAVFETETFIKALKEILKDAAETETMDHYQSEVSSSSALMSSNTWPSRDRLEDLSDMSPVQLYSPQLPLSLNYEVEQEPSTREAMLNHNYKGISPALPPSFTSLMNNCCSSEVKQAASQPSVAKEMDLKSQIERCMQDSSFQDILVKVERVISEIGDDFLLEASGAFL